MEHARFDVQSAQQSRPANAEHLFLHHPRFAIATVQMTRHQTISFFVLGHISIQQVQPHAADVGAPHAGAHRATAHRDFNAERPAFLVVHAAQR